MSVQLYRVVPIEHRRAILQQAVAHQVSNFGTVIYQSDTYAIIDYTQPTNHTAHLLVSIFLCGLWLPFWVIIAIVQGRQVRRSVAVDEWGRVHIQRVD